MVPKSVSFCSFGVSRAVFTSISLHLSIYRIILHVLLYRVELRVAASIAVEAQHDPILRQAQATTRDASRVKPSVRSKLVSDILGGR